MSRQGPSRRPPRAENSYPSRRSPSPYPRHRAPVVATSRRPRRRPKKYIIKPRFYVIMTILLLLILFGLSRCMHSESVVSGGQDHHVANTTGANPLDNKLKSRSAVLLDMKNGKVIYAKNADTKRYPASLTKMVTVYLALQENKDIEATVKMPDAAFDGLDGSGAATSGLMAGDSISIKELMYGAIIPSGADAAKALAIISDGDETAFVSKMNKLAAEFGMKNTHFTNASGLHDPKQVTSANDLALFMRHALKDKQFRAIMETYSYDISADGSHPEGISWHNFMDKYHDQIHDLTGNGVYQYRGGKTGYTPEAGLCLASYAEDDSGHIMIAIILKAPGNSGNYLPVIKDTLVMYDEGYKDL